MIELLVVISVISLLIALLLPALQGARRAAESVQCLSHLRQQGVGFNTYLSDYRDTLYHGSYPDNSTGWPSLVGQYLGYGSNKSEVYNTCRDLGTQQAFSCPSNPQNRWGAFNTYGMNRFRWSSHPSKPAKYPQASRVTATTELFITGDMTFKGASPVTCAIGRFQIGTTRAWLYNPHNSATNILYWDGHAATIGMPDWQAVVPAPSGNVFDPAIIGEDFWTPYDPGT